ncbi:DNA-binding protein [Delftia tsuruhatensis]|uniref:nucleotide-binding protein n=1 Tax=Delftia TaxID=80865 RepID=UPI00105660BB|nr:MULTISPECIES: nucleotide-binding protein [Delftia]MCX7509495.1 nucleotide-binding protein [Delftia tsuruhatensis]TDF22776.1 DNA-binding protein [Delftia tsuruhatensis]
MTKPRVFIGSSVEGLNVAYAVQQNLLHDAEVTVWDQGVFELSKTTIETLSKALEENDFAVFVFSPDDLVRIRSMSTLAVRDNVLFEFGLFIGRLGRDRVYFLLPMVGELHLPTDLLGITPGRYESQRSDGSMQAATGPVCHQIRTQMKTIGSVPGRAATVPSGETEAVTTTVRRSWIQDYFEEKFDAAKVTLEAESSTQTGEDAAATRVWILSCELRLRNDGDTRPLTDLASRHSDSPRIQVLVATMLRIERYTSKAIEILLAAKSAFPRDASITQAIARCHGDAADNTSAIAELEQFGPDSFPDIAIDLAEVLERDEKLEDALHVIQRCHANHPAHKGIRLKYARLAQELEKPYIALALLNSLKREDQKSIEYWGYLGNSCLELDLYDMALFSYRSAEQLMTPEQGSQWIISNIGNLFNNKELPTEACNYLERALKSDPYSEYAHDRMAKALKKKAAEENKFQRMCAEGMRQIREAEMRILSPETASLGKAEGMLSFNTSVDA